MNKDFKNNTTTILRKQFILKYSGGKNLALKSLLSVKVLLCGPKPKDP